MPIDGTTGLIVYNSSNITGLECLIHRGDKVVVEVSDGAGFYLQVIRFKLG